MKSKKSQHESQVHGKVVALNPLFSTGNFLLLMAEDSLRGRLQDAQGRCKSDRGIFQ